MIDLRSDTKTNPSPEMRAAIAEAEVGDEQRRLDPTVNRLQERVAEELGQEAAVLLPTGTMCNLIAVATHTRPGEAIVLENRVPVRPQRVSVSLSKTYVVKPGDSLTAIAAREPVVGVSGWRNVADLGGRL